MASGETVDPVVADLASHKGCQMWGFLEVNKVAGNFHFAPGKSFQHQHMHVHDLAAYQQQIFNVTHRIDALSFGEPFPGQINPLDGANKSHPTQDPNSRQSIAESGGMFMSAATAPHHSTAAYHYTLSSFLTATLHHCSRRLLTSALPAVHRSRYYIKVRGLQSPNHLRCLLSALLPLSLSHPSCYLSSDLPAVCRSCPRRTPT